MSRFTDQQCTRVDDKDITFKTRPGLDMAAVAAVPDLIRDAKDVLSKAIQAIDTKPSSVWTAAMANRYFLTSLSAGPSSKDLVIIKRVLTSTLTGLSGPMTLKLGAVVSRSEKTGVLGSVSSARGRTATKAYHNVVKDMTPVNHFWQKAPSIVTGAMKLQDSALLGPLGLVTLIHEATHKFAGTDDYCYFDDATGTVPRGKFTSKDKALGNADSYAYFAIKVAHHH